MNRKPSEEVLDHERKRQIEIERLKRQGAGVDSDDDGEPVPEVVESQERRRSGSRERRSGSRERRSGSRERHEHRSRSRSRERRHRSRSPRRHEERRRKSRSPERSRAKRSDGGGW